MDVVADASEAPKTSPDAERPSGPSANEASKPTLIFVVCASANSVTAVSSRAVTVSLMPIPNMAPKDRPSVPTAHGADQEPTRCPPAADNIATI